MKGFDNTTKRYIYPTNGIEFPKGGRWFSNEADRYRRDPGWMVKFSMDRTGSSLVIVSPATG